MKATSPQLFWLVLMTIKLSRVYHSSRYRNSSMRELVKEVTTRRKQENFQALCDSGYLVEAGPGGCDSENACYLNSLLQSRPEMHSSAAKPLNIALEFPKKQLKGQWRFCMFLDELTPTKELTQHSLYLWWVFSGLLRLNLGRTSKKLAWSTDWFYLHNSGPQRAKQYQSISIDWGTWQ